MLDILGRMCISGGKPVGVIQGNDESYIPQPAERKHTFQDLQSDSYSLISKL